MIHKDEILSAIDSTPGRLAILLVAFVAQVPHTIAVFRDGAMCGTDASLTQCVELAQAVAAGIALEGGILFVLLRGWHVGSYMFALISVAINVAFYAMKHENSVQALTWIEWLKSAIIPLVIAIYSHLLAASDVRVRATASRKYAIFAWVKSLANRIATQLQPVQAPAQIEMQVDDVQDAPELQPVQEKIASDAKSLYLQGRASGRNHSELVQELGVKDSTAASWWRRNGNSASKLQFATGD